MERKRKNKDCMGLIRDQVSALKPEGASVEWSGNGLRAVEGRYAKCCLLAALFGWAAVTAAAGEAALEPILENTHASMTVEVEASYSDQGSEESSDLALATFELDLESRLAEGVSVYGVLLWEEDDTEPIDLDEGYVVVGGAEVGTPLFLKAGKMYVPFGAFNTWLVSDPLVQELGETRESAVIAGCELEQVTIQAGAFNGDLDDADDEDRLDDLVAVVQITPVDGVEIGAYWISDIGESDGLQDELEDAVAGTPDRIVVGEDGRPAVEAGSPGVPYDEVDGAGGYISLALGPAAIEAEYLTALDDFDAGLLGDKKVKPSAWNVELAYTLAEKWTLSARYEGSDDFLDFPEDQYGGAVSWSISDNLALAVEYLHGEFAGDVDSRDLVTAQLAVTY